MGWVSARYCGKWASAWQMQAMPAAAEERHWDALLKLLKETLG